MPTARLRTAALAGLLAGLLGGPASSDGAPSFAPVELAPIEHGGGMLDVVAADGSTTTYSAGDLERLPTYAIETTTPWEPEPLRFEGIMLVDLLARHGLAGMDIEVLAEDEFVSRIEAHVSATGDFMIATRVDGQPLTPAYRGPLLFVVPSTSLGEGSVISERHLVWMAAQIRPLG